MVDIGIRFMYLIPPAITLVILLLLKRGYFSPEVILFLKNSILMFWVPLLFEMFMPEGYVAAEYKTTALILNSIYSITYLSMVLLMSILFFRNDARFRKKLNVFVTNSRRLFLIAILAFVFLITYAKLDFMGLVLEPRLIYQYNRFGQGIYYATYVVLINIFVLNLTFLNRNVKLKSAVLVILVSMFLGYFSASKSVILYQLLLLIIAYSYKNRPSFLKQTLVLIIVSCSIFIVFPLFGELTEAAKILLYFDHFRNNIVFFEMFSPKIDYFWSSFWGYVPRSIFPSKPFVYGDIYLTELLYPGIAQKGHTVGGLPYTLYLISFGALGVAFSATIDILSIETLKHLFVRFPNYFTLTLTLHFLFIPIFKYFPPLFAVILALIIHLFFKLRLRISLKIH